MKEKTMVEIMKRQMKIKGNLMLLITAMIWGCAFVAQSAGMDYVGPFTFQAVRSFLGAFSLIVVIVILDGIKKKNGTYRKMSIKDKKMLWLGGLCCGTFLCAACCFQQVGICYTTVGKSGFITAMYILLVPVLGLFIKKKVPVKIWFCIALGIAGLYFLCINEGFSVNKGDLLMLVCALLFSFHILCVDYFSARTDGVKLSCIQFLVAGIIASVLMAILEEPNIGNITAAWLPIVYAGVASCGIAYTLQIVGQKYTDAASAALLMSLESVFAVLGGMVMLHEMPSAREWLGIVLMFAAIIISQLPERDKKE